MNESERELSKLLVEVAFASVNNNMRREAEQLHDVLPKLGINEALSKVCQSILCFGMQKNSRASELVQGSDMIEAQAMRIMLGESHSLELDKFNEQEPAVQLIKLLSQQRER
ncbi:DUF1039 domain-containing protein [Vibrio sp. S4M6]|uniref:DUF1039 domain-containing protein n=1 Tax=Vibrio sinus TaxID=2946865 RepID=UPI00202A8F0A|nr:DUF1039 domain-containing protein [Vibrio sinus]MCL9783826.1 DUF1039 domain-containing protein [Vibrio sinus]